MKRTIILHNRQQAKVAMSALWDEIRGELQAERRLIVTVKPETRSDAQNRRLWAMLADISRQVIWHGQRLTPEEFKHIFSAALARQKVVPGLDGGFVVLGQSTSKMSKAEIGELMTLMEAFGAEQSVKFTAQDQL